MANLRAVAGQLIDHRISIRDACTKAQEAILGTPTTSSGITGRVLRGSSEVVRDLDDLRAYIKEYSLDDPEKWAGTLLMLHVQLAIGDVNAAIRLSKSVLQVSCGVCPATARPYAAAIVDTMLLQAGDLTPPEREIFAAAREVFRRNA